MENKKELKILSRVIIHIAGNPQTHIIKSMDLLIKKIQQDENFQVVSIEPSEVSEEEGMFTIFAEIELRTKDIDQLAWFCFDYLPSSVEIIEPRELIYRADHLSSFFNEMQNRMHSLDLALKTLTMENKKLHTNGSALMRNLLYYITKTPKSLEDISKATGISKEELAPIINTLLEQKRLVLESEKYKWNIIGN